MVDVSEFIKIKTNFLKPQDIKDLPNEIFQIVDSGEILKNKFGTERLHMLGIWNNGEKTFDCSKSNANIIAGRLGTDTQKWNGAKLKLSTFRTQTSEGKKVDAIEVIGVEAQK